jgi:uncharacterized protein YihD (DUF1040 family)
MRNPERIDAVIEAVRKEWKQVPDWRLGQLIVNISRAAGKMDPFFLEDDMLLKVISDDAGSENARESGEDSGSEVDDSSL